MKKGINLLELLFVVFLVMSLSGVKPFTDWSWWKIVLPLGLDVAIKLLKLIWTNFGFEKIIYSEFENARYDVKLKREIRKAKKDIENKKF